MVAGFGNSWNPWPHPSAHHLLQLCQVPGVHGRQDPGPCIVRHNLSWFWVKDTIHWHFMFYICLNSPWKQNMTASVFVAVMKNQTHTEPRFPECSRMTRRLWRSMWTKWRTSKSRTFLHSENLAIWKGSYDSHAMYVHKNFINPGTSTSGGPSTWRASQTWIQHCVFMNVLRITCPWFESTATWGTSRRWLHWDYQPFIS